MKAKGIVTVGASEHPSEGVQAGWKRVKASKILQELLCDRQTVEAQIQQQPFLLGSWFSLAKLFGGKNCDGEYIASKIMAGGYASTAKQSGRTVTYTGEYDPSHTGRDF